MSQNSYEREREERIKANKARLAELVTQRLPAAPRPASVDPRSRERTAGYRKRSAPEVVVPREKSSRSRAPVDYREPAGDPGDRDGSSRGERGRYDAPGATSCHSCRQKTDSYKAECTECPLKWCAPCLRTRYGEDAREANVLGDWLCGKCRGGCLCSNCRRKAGKAPTGVLGPAAEAAGYDSVAEYLAAGGR